MTRLSDVKLQQQDSELPPIGQRVLVECDDYRCLAYRGETGRWYNAFNNQELPKIIRVCFLK